MNDQSWSGGVEASEGPFAAKVEAGPDVTKEVVSAAQERPDIETMDEVEIARDLFWSYVKDMTHHRHNLEDTGDGSGLDENALKDARRLARDVRAATQYLLEERNKVDKLRKDIAGGVGGGALDLDAARDEIGRRLACLRRAG